MVKLDRDIRVLIVDDSVVVRELFKEILEKADGISIIGEAANGKEAVDKTRLLKPDLITMDVAMPVMDGLEAVRRIMAKTPTPILIVTASLSREDTDVSFQAISDGALDIMLKPPIESAADLDTFKVSFLEKIRILSRVRVISHFGRKPRRTRTIPRGVTSAHEYVVAIGASTGGPDAVMKVLKALPGDFPTPVAVVQHITAGFDKGFAGWLDRRLPFEVKVAGQDDRLKPGQVLIAPTNLHLRFAGHRALLDDSPPINSCKPAVDALFMSLAEGFKSKCLGVILTGIGSDGTEGARLIKERGGTTIAQDLETSVVYGMPKSAIDEGAIDMVLPLEKIPEMLVQVVTARKR